MKLTLKELNSLSPVQKMKRTKIENYNLVCEQNHRSIIFLYKYKSPLTQKTRLAKLSSYEYASISKLDIQFIKDIELKYKHQVEIKGIDLLAEKKALREEIQHKKEYKQVNDLWKEIEHSSKFKRLATSSQITYTLCFANHIKSRFGTKQVTEYNRANVEAFLDTLSVSVALLALAVFKKIEKQALAHEIIPANRLTDFELAKPGERSFSLSDEEIKRLWNYVDSDEVFLSISGVIKFQLLTGCRVSEITKAKWDEFKDGVWTIPPERIKTEKEYKGHRRPHQLPITPIMQKILDEQKKLGSEWVFESQTHRAMSTPTLRFHFKAAGLSYLGSHVLRKTVASNVAKLTNSEEAVKIILNHGRWTGSTSAYIDKGLQFLDKKLEILNVWQNHLSAMIDESKRA